ncbi:uncharacterized protein [Henckelia pumila]|uniref:uncharacterized protein n=1 Tax=Henckelia pumila TaxID=405737 RepID=UPI003C6E662E
MGERTALNCLIKFCQCVIEMFGARYLRRPNDADTQRLLQMHEEKHGFPGMSAALIACIMESIHNELLSSRVCHAPRIPRGRQDSARKDVERAFGALQARWKIVRGSARFYYKNDLRNIMYTCIILHNMIIENEGDESVNWSDEDSPPPSRIVMGSTKNSESTSRIIASYVTEKHITNSS